jgi:DNA-binding transcriptional ArsR family regulator
MVSVSAWAGVDPDATVARSSTDRGTMTGSTPRPRLRFPPGCGRLRARISPANPWYTIYVTTQIAVIPSEEEIQSAVGMLKLLGDETRLRIIWALLDGEHSVNELAELVGAQAAGVSQHLAKLRLARLVRTRRDGTRIFYVADDVHVRRLVEEVLSHADHITRATPPSTGSGSGSGSGSGVDPTQPATGRSRVDT